MTAIGIELIRAAVSRFFSVIRFSPKGKKLEQFLMTLCERTVPMAKIAPSQVDILALTIPIKPQPPRKAGATFVSNLITAPSSGSHNAHVGRPRAM